MAKSSRGDTVSLTIHLSSHLQCGTDILMQQAERGINAPGKIRRVLTGNIGNSAGHSCCRKRISTWERHKEQLLQYEELGKVFI